MQKECEIRFNLTHKVPIIKHNLAKKLRYLEDEGIAKAITGGSYEIPTDLDEPIKYTLEEIGKMGMKIMSKEGEQIIITPDDFKRFWKRVGKFTTSSRSSIHYRHYLASVQNEASVKIHAQQLTVRSRSEVCSERWNISL